MLLRLLWYKKHHSEVLNNRQLPRAESLQGNTLLLHSLPLDYHGKVAVVGKVGWVGVLTAAHIFNKPTDDAVV